MEPAWINFDTEKDGLKFGLVRLRIIRNYTYELWTVLAPLFFIVLTSFSVFFLSNEDLSSRLQIGIAILLTFAAFQSVVEDKLPETAEMKLINIYILCAYIVLVFMIIGSCMVSTIDDHDTALYIDGIFLAIGLSFWCLFSIWYLLRPCLYRCNIDWDKRAQDEIRKWNKNDHKHGVDRGHVYGSYDKNNCKFVKI